MAPDRDRSAAAPAFGCVMVALLLLACANPTTAASFDFIGPKTTMQQVIDGFGAPDADIGSGIHIYVYRLDDGTEIWIGSPDGSEIWYVRHRSMTPEKLRTIYERK